MPYSSAAGPIPQGNAFLVQTPQTNRAIDELQADRQRREEFARKQSLTLDQQMSKEFSDIKNADAPEIIGMYRDYKNSMMEIHNDKKIRNNPELFAQKKMEADQKLGRLYSSIGASKEGKQTGEDYFTSYRGGGHDRFVDNFGKLHQAYMNTPTSKLKDVEVDGVHYDLSNPETFFDTTPRADMNKLMTTAIGKKGIKYAPSVPVGEGGLENEITPYSYANNPAQVYSSLVDQFAEKKAGKSARVAWESLTPDQIDHVDELYSKITPEEWKQRTGSEIAPELPAYDPNHPENNYAIFRSKRYAVENAAEKGEPKRIKNAQAQKDYDQALKEKNMATQYDYATRKLKFSSALALDRQEAFDDTVRHRNELSNTQKDEAANLYVQGDIKAAKAGKPETLKTKNGSIEVYRMPVMNEVADELALQTPKHKLRPNDTYISKDGKEIIGAHKSKDADGNEVVTLVRKPVSTLLPVVKNVLIKGHRDKEGSAGEQPKPNTSGKTKFSY